MARRVSSKAGRTVAGPSSEAAVPASVGAVASAAESGGTVSAPAAAPVSIVAPASDSDSASSSAVSRGSPLSDDPRQAAVDRVVKDRTREERARLVRRGDYEALLVRGQKVNHGLHRASVVALAAVAFVGAIVFGMSAVMATLVGASVGAAYALYWLFLTLTGGEEEDLVRADESGHVTVARSGRLVETRGNVLRIGVPIAVLAFCGYLAVSLALDIRTPPAPHCNATASVLAVRPDACITVADPGGRGVVGTDFPVGAVFTVDQAKALDTWMRLLQFVAVTAGALVALIFLWAMLTDRHFLVVTPLRRPRSSTRSGTPGA